MNYVFSMAVGMLLGVFYYYGLWLITRYIIRSVYIKQNKGFFQSPHILAFLSFIIRTGVVLAGFFWTMSGQWQRLIFALLGFFLARVLIRMQIMKGVTSYDNQP